MVCVPPETDAKTRVLVQIVYLGGEETPCRKQENETRKERQPKMFLSKPSTTVGDWT